MKKNKHIWKWKMGSLLDVNACLCMYVCQCQCMCVLYVHMYICMCMYDFYVMYMLYMCICSYINTIYFSNTVALIYIYTLKYIHTHFAMLDSFNHRGARSPQPAARSPQPAARSPQPAARSPHSALCIQSVPYITTKYIVGMLTRETSPGLLLYCISLSSSQIHFQPPFLYHLQPYVCRLQCVFRHFQHRLGR
jgi:hypothetical protein